MTAYGAVISLKNTIDYIINSSHFSLVGLSLPTILFAYHELQPLQEILKRLDSSSKSRSRKKVNALDGRIKEKIWEFEDLLESLLTDQILSQVADQVDGGINEKEWQFQGLWESLPSQQIQFQSRRLDQVELTGSIDHRRRRLLHEHKGDRLKSRRKFKMQRSSSAGGDKDVLLFSINVLHKLDDVCSFVETLKDMKKEYIYELHNMPQDDDDEIGFVFGGSKSKMIGLSDQFQRLKSTLMRIHRTKHVLKLVGVVLIGTAGVGKTTLAKEIFQDPQIMTHFDHRAWVTVGRKSQFEEVSRCILAQLCGITIVEGYETVGDYLKQRLKGKKCLIVLDDVWEAQVLNSLISYIPDIKNGSIQFLVTARERNVIAKTTSKIYFYFDWVRFLNEEESKDLLCHKVFGDEICPPQLEKAASKIAKHCEGLPLTIVTVADLLSKSQNRDPDYWNDVAEERNSVFTDAYNEITKVLFPSYDYLPQYLKMPLLYLGVFPPDYDILPSKIINMLTAEGWFLHTNKTQSLKKFVWLYLDELCSDKNLVLFNRKSIFWYGITCRRVFKTCRLHSSWRHVCRGEARKNKFYHVLNRLVDAEEEVAKGQRCLCLQNNILFGIKEFCNSVRLNCASSTRSLLFFGPYHQYPTPIDVGFRLLKELDALKLRFYTFPTEILTLVQLKYLALTCNGQLPTTISKLFNLRILIIHPHMNIQCCRTPSYVPIQIWDMQELEHIEILGKSLVAPYHVVSLENLSTLVGVNASICTIFELFRRVPNIRKLGIQIELRPYEDHNNLLSCFGCISTLGSLETLKCSIINPVIKSGYVVPATVGPLMLPRGLKKLHLSGMGFPWEYMDVIGFLPFLQVLKLRSYAFRGSKWKAQEKSFMSLEFLLIEDNDLVQWKPRSGSFPKLRFLSMKHCYKLEEIHWPASRCIKIELVDCNPLALTWAKQLQRSLSTRLHVTASSTFYVKPMTIEFERSFTGDEDTNEEDEEEDDDENLADDEGTYGENEEENDDEDLADDEDTDEKEEEEDDDEDVADRGREDDEDEC